MGPENKMPPPPKFRGDSGAGYPSSYVETDPTMQLASRTQGGLDQIHVPILHKTFRAELADSGIAAQSFIGRTGMPVFRD